MPDAREPGHPDVTIVAHDIGSVGGMERQLTELISGLLEAGHRVTAISRTCSIPCHPNLRWRRVSAPARPFAIAYPAFFLLASLLVWARRRGVVHSTGAIVFNRTSVCTVHLCHRATAELPEFSRISRPSVAHRVNAGIAGVMSRLAERWCYRPGRARRLVGVSEGVAEELHRHYPRMRRRIVVVPNGVNTEAFRPADGSDRAPGPNGLAALFVGGEWRGKGLRFAIEALGGCPWATLTVVGRGDVDSFRGLAESCGVAEQVRFVGASADVARWYRRADVFLLPTAYESFSLVTYEAAACGLPLLVTKVSGVEDLLHEGVNGWFIERDPQDIRKRISELRDDPGLRLALGDAARRSSLEYSWSRVVELYRDLYAELAGVEGPPR